MRGVADDTRAVVHNPRLRQTHLAYGATLASEWAYFTALEVFAFEVGGPFAVGLVIILSELPAAAAVPITALLGERVRRDVLLCAVACVRSAELCAAAVAFSSGAPPELFYALLGADSILSSATFPAQQGLLPRLATSPRQVTTSVGITALVEGVGTSLGPLIGGVLLATTDLTVVYAFAAAVMLSTGILFLRAGQSLRSDPLRTTRPQGQPLMPPFEVTESRGLLTEFLAGIRAIARHRDALIVLVLFSVDAVTYGALDVFVVVIALKTIQIGPEGFGALAAVEMIGGILGGIVAIAFVRRRRLATRWTVLGLVDGVPPVLIASFPVAPVAITMLIIWGAIDVIDEGLGLELIRRIVPTPLLSHALGLEDSLVTLGIALGALIAPALIAALGVRGALVAVGLIAPLVAATTLRAMTRIDSRTDSGSPAPEPVPPEINE
jgi:predicted MFS family arabinose efflux permease